MTEGPLQVLAEDVLPALKHASSSGADSHPAVDFACLPLGFTTGGGSSHIFGFLQSLATGCCVATYGTCFDPSTCCRAQ